ncbi:MAG: PAS domain S-box protein [Acidobacteriota bacterium]
MTKLSKPALYSPPELLKLYQDLVETSHDIIWQVDSDGCFTYLNPATEAIFGYQIEDMLGHPFTEYQTPDAAAATLERFALLLQENILKGYETTFIARSGTPIHVVINSVSIRDERGVILGARGTAHDITQRKLAEEALRESEQRLKFHFENSPLAVVEWDGDFHVTQWSAEAERMFEWKKEETLGMRIDRLHLIHAEDIPIVERTMKRLTGREAGPVVVSSNRNRTKSGAVIECVWYNTILLDGKGEMSSVLSLVEDVTEQRRAERELRSLYEQTQRDAVAKTELLNEVNHRVKNNLMAVLGLILAEKRKQTAHAEGLGIWTRFENRINGMLCVHQMLSDSQWKPIVLTELAERICARALDDDGEMKEEVSLHIEHDSVTVSARQAGNLALVLTELTMNSMKHAFMKAGGDQPSITIRARRAADRICIEFRDNGGGYPDDILEGALQYGGLRLARQIVEETLDGRLEFVNAQGASALICMGAEDVDLTQ